MNISFVTHLPKFGKQMRVKDLKEIRPLILQIPDLKDVYISHKFSSVLESPSHKLEDLEPTVKKEVMHEAKSDTSSNLKAAKKYFKDGGRGPIASLQLFRLQKPASKALELTHDECKLTKNGTPATGQALQGKYMLNWQILDKY